MTKVYKELKLEDFKFVNEILFVKIKYRFNFDMMENTVDLEKLNEELINEIAPSAPIDAKDIKFGIDLDCAYGDHCATLFIKYFRPVNKNELTTYSLLLEKEKIKEEHIALEVLEKNELKTLFKKGLRSLSGEELEKFSNLCGKYDKESIKLFNKFFGEPKENAEEKSNNFTFGGE